MKIKTKFIIYLPSPGFVYEVTMILPFVSILICWSIYYSTSHYRRGRIRTISETVMFFPENRIFPVAMSIDAILLLLIFLMRQKIIRKLAEKNDLFKNNSYQKFNKIAYSLIISSTLGLFLLSNVTLKDSKVVHLVSACFFFFGIIIYLGLSDIWAKRVGYKIGYISTIIPYLAFVLATIYTIITLILYRNRFIYSIGSLLEYASSALIFLKIYLMRKETPTHTILNGKEQEKFN